MFKNIKLLMVFALVFGPLAANATIIINNSSGGLYNSGIGDLASVYGPTQFPGANSSEGDPLIVNAAEPTTFTAAFGTDWLNGNYTGGSWGVASPIPLTWAVNTESAVVYNFLLSSLSDIHIDLGVDNGIYVWFDGLYKFGALAPGGANLNEYDIDITGVGTGNHRLQILREDHGGGTGYAISVDVTASSVSVPEPTTLALVGIGLAGLGFSRRRKKL
ncbi:MAG: hypothetical protein A3I78_11525 [Gammaproteobacteria bacterium RIFCSPLOWO2_02_FULL_56_15]|nr:MAG: hypothetical protein A3I78_11525 [Gammaproteobacteria bacterium RIFCSPLOWO2_02_FULL_56_15]